MSAAVAVLPPPNPEAERQAALDRYAILDTAPEAAFDDIVRLAVLLCDTPAAGITLIDRGRVWFKARWGIEVDAIPRQLALSERLLRTRRTLVVSDLLADARGAASPLRIDDRPVRFFAGAPLLSPDGHVLGVLCVGDTMPRTLTARQREGLELLARQVTQLFELRRYANEQHRLLSEREAVVHHAERARAELQDRHERLLHTARRDELTGLLNRAALAQMLRDPEQMQRFGSATFSLILVDIDHFKQVNDRHGHLLGDRALREVAAVVRASVREDDIAVRFGGEEFLIVLPGTGLAHAAEIAHRIREQVAEAVLPFPLTVSAGVAGGHPSQDKPEQVFDRADQALYRAKASGRNRVIIDDTLRV